MYCTNCGTKLNTDCTFCPNCGNLCTKTFDKSTKQAATISKHYTKTYQILHKLSFFLTGFCLAGGSLPLIKLEYVYAKDIVFYHNFLSYLNNINIILKSEDSVLIIFLLITGCFFLSAVIWGIFSLKNNSRLLAVLSMICFEIFTCCYVIFITQSESADAHVTVSLLGIAMLVAPIVNLGLLAYMHYLDTHYH